MEGYLVREIKRNDCEDFIINIHYAKRWPSITYSYGLFLNEELVGIVTYGTPFSCTLRIGLAGKENAHNVIELNRLCLRNNLKNEASFLVGKSLRMLPKKKIVVSFADTSQGHTGVVYQACNFVYCGLSAKRTDWKIKGMEHLHGQTISDIVRNKKNRADALREIYGDDFYLSPRPRKHRYIYITGSKNQKESASKVIKYKQFDYPRILQA